MVGLKSGLEIDILLAADATRRRRWSKADKLRIVEASFRGSRVVSAMARAHGISWSLLTAWRRQCAGGGTLGTLDRQPSFALVLMASEVTSKAEPTSEPIEIGNGRRLIIGIAIDRRWRGSGTHGAVRRKLSAAPAAGRAMIVIRFHPPQFERRRFPLSVAAPLALAFGWLEH